jgi:hypothetical protein
MNATSRKAKTPQGWQAKGAFNIASDNANNTSISKNILAEHFCFCRPGVPCILCVEWNRITRHLEAPRILSTTQSLFRPAHGQIGGA